jgi:hypothetical protein
LVLAGVVVLLGAGLLVSGCSSRDPNAKLTDEEGAALLKDVRKNPPNPDDLTPAEKKFLKDYVAGQRAK